MNPSRILLSLAFIVFPPTTDGLSPATKPEDIILAQLSSLRNADMAGVYAFASPANKQQTGDVHKFGEMVRSGPYRYLVGHKRADILMSSTVGASKQYLVRVVALDTNSSSKKIKEYWWSLSRCRTGSFEGCYMVDAVLPNML